ncbi:transglutaminase domain-containing protein [Rhizobium sp. 9140]|uniref:transglutaminase domain-containing protein n=1 Tax=Rhizobium sp. 9140 TaxID=1761900 RepID=UPI0007922869|nr:transglutaminase domain-containing protein [Rhizobium sp. 9140]CZT34855.1 Transglutaminase-like superfamily protein [Rhizobium sp. 9140]
MMHKTFYVAQSIYSAPGSCSETLTRVDADPKVVAQWVSSFMQHPRGPESKERGFASEQVDDLELRSVADILSLAMKRGLFSGKPSNNKIGGVCRDFAILAVSRFREAGIPARLRVGFADYLVPGHWEDHWLCEWWDGGQWKRLDVEFAALDVVDFDPLNVPCERFLTASDAWFLIKDQPEISLRFGVSSLDLRGEWFLAGSLLREIAALRRLELKPWDYWGISQNLSRLSSEWSRESRETLNQLASRLKNAELEGVGAPTDLADLPLPKCVTSFPKGEAVFVKLRD